jgi:hypothetical protein
VLRNLQFVCLSAPSTDSRRFQQDESIVSHHSAQIFFIDTISRQPKKLSSRRPSSPPFSINGAPIHRDPRGNRAVWLGLRDLGAGTAETSIRFFAVSEHDVNRAARLQVTPILPGVVFYERCMRCTLNAPPNWGKIALRNLILKF